MLRNPTGKIEGTVGKPYWLHKNGTYSYKRAENGMEDGKREDSFAYMESLSPCATLNDHTEDKNVLYSMDFSIYYTYSTYYVY
jgi:hypothetical protein